jgi:hypothetical protein
MPNGVWTPASAGPSVASDQAKTEGSDMILSTAARRRADLRSTGTCFRLSEVLMKSFIALVTVAAVACAIAVPASAMPTDAGPRAVAHVRHAAPVAPVGDDGTPAYVFVLIGCGAATALGAGGFLGARSATRRLSPRAS